MTVHEIDGTEYVHLDDYQAVVEQARALDNELALVRMELRLEQASDVRAVEPSDVVVDFMAERARRRPQPAA